MLWHLQLVLAGEVDFVGLYLPSLRGWCCSGELKFNHFEAALQTSRTINDRTASNQRGKSRCRVFVHYNTDNILLLQM